MVSSLCIGLSIQAGTDHHPPAHQWIDLPGFDVYRVGALEDEPEQTIVQLSGHTEPYAVLGHPIGHSLSPVFHNASFRALEMDAVYLAFDVAPDLLMGVLPAMRDMGFRGVNLTVPLKEVAFRGISDLDSSARHLGAVNTVEFKPDGGMRGHNTDGYGFLVAIEEAFGASVEGLSIFVLGAGGAGRAVAITCAVQGAAQIAIADIDGERTSRLAAEIAELAPTVEVADLGVDRAAWQNGCLGADLVVHATPIGMKPGEESLLGQDSFHDGQMVFDMIYMYPQTSFMGPALAAGAKAVNGLGMLLHQGARSFEIWSGRKAAIDAMRVTLEEAVYGRS